MSITQHPPETPSDAHGPWRTQLTADEAAAVAELDTVIDLHQRMLKHLISERRRYEGRVHTRRWRARGEQRAA